MENKKLPASSNRTSFQEFHNFVKVNTSEINQNKTINILTLTQKNTVVIEKRVRHFLFYEHVQTF